jgi:hypothetical protein
VPAEFSLNSLVGKSDNSIAAGSDTLSPAKYAANLSQEAKLSYACIKPPDSAVLPSLLKGFETSRSFHDLLGSVHVASEFRS